MEIHGPGHAVEAGVDLLALVENVGDVDRRLGGIDQVVHTWLAPGVVVSHRFMDLDEDQWAAGCEHSLAAAWWLARASAEPLRASGAVREAGDRRM